MNARTLSDSCLALSGATLAALLLVAPAGAQVRRTEKRFTVGDKPMVILQNPSGRIQIKSWARHEVLVVAQIASDKVEVDTEQVDNRVDITTQLVGAGSAPADRNADLDCHRAHRNRAASAHRFRQRHHRQRARRHVV